MVETNKKPLAKQYPDVICFGGEDWWYHNRGHIDMQLMRRFARTGTTVYVNSIVMQKPNLSQPAQFLRKLKRKAKSIFNGLKTTDAGFWAYSPASLPFHHIWWARPINRMLLLGQIAWVARKIGITRPLVWVACPAACDVALRLKKQKLVYQRTDRFEEYPNVHTEAIETYDHTLKAHADLTIFVNHTLYRAEAHQCRKAVYLDHGVDYEMFASAENDHYLPPDLAPIKKPVIGFFGGIDDHTFDIDLTQSVVNLLPEMSFVFVGNASADCSGLQAAKNAFMLGQKPYEQIPHYGKCFDVAIMPWRQNAWIQACNPVKLKEYLALGKPVVSTPFAELQNYADLVYQAKSPQEFAQCIQHALADNCPDLIAARRKKVSNSSWDHKAQFIRETLFTHSK